MIMLLNAKDILYICTILILMDISIRLKIAKRPNIYIVIGAGMDYIMAIF